MSELGAPVGLCLAALVACAACRPKPTETDPPPPAPAPLVDEGPPPEVVATMTCFVGAPWQLSDGTLTHMTMTLIVRRDGGAELHDIDAKGRLLARTAIAPARIDRLALTVGEPAWASLVHVRGSPYPDGASCEILANHRRVKRFDDPADEPIVKEVWRYLKAMWADTERAWVK